MKQLLPAYPLWIIDPNFSVWAQHDELNGADTMFWTGLSRKTYGTVRYNGNTYCFLGNRNDCLPLTQKNVKITAFGTEYTFENDQFTLIVNFLSPLPPDNLQLLSCPVCYTEYKLQAKGAMAQDFSIAICLDEEYAYHDPAFVTGAVLPGKNYETAYLSRARNLMMSNSCDLVAPDWGDTYLAGEDSYFVTQSAYERYLADGVPVYARVKEERNCIYSVNKSASGFFMTAFDDRVSIFYLGEWLKCYWFKDEKTIMDALAWSYDNYAQVKEICNAFDAKLYADCQNVGNGYYDVACASLRQSVGAHKLVEAKSGLLFLSKECDSNGCINTVDVSYPSMPLYLIYNPELVNAMMRGIFEFADLPVWTYDFAPHDLGTYPWAAGQVYGLRTDDSKYGANETWGLCGELKTHHMFYLYPAESNVYNFDKQMPVEECGNMLIMAAAAMVAGADKSLIKKNFHHLKTWVKYLEKFGLKPANQLCTDDFAGHLANNVNLAIKALVGIESYSVICRQLGKNKIADAYMVKAQKFAAKFKKLVGDDVMPLTYRKKNSFSLKYNMLFDKLFGFNLFTQEEREREIDYYITQNNEFGVPLDTRKTYTKSDWILWTVALTDDKTKAEALYQPVLHYLQNSTTRVPFGDWYDTISGKFEHFRNRTVQGGNFAPLLKYFDILNLNK